MPKIKPKNRDNRDGEDLIRKRAIVVCGPTASGKSDLSDRMAESISAIHKRQVPVIVIDSMQVYREIPTITNQERSRPAEMLGIISITEEWNVACHKEAAEGIIVEAESTFILDSGTGMYLNALLLDTDLAPRVSEHARRLAIRETTGSTNQRRAAREMELRISGATPRSSIWDGELPYETNLVYVRPDRVALDLAIKERSERISSGGVGEAELISAMIADGQNVTPSVMEAIGVKELIERNTGALTRDEALERISSRTRKLARRQMRWFDKLVRVISGRSSTLVVENTSDRRIMHAMHDIV